jgi:hypothetical protein
MSHNQDIEVNVDSDFSLEYLDTLIKEDYIESKYSGVEYNPVHCSLDNFLTLTRQLMDIHQEGKTHKVILIDDFSKNNIFEDPKNPKTEVLAVVTCSVRGQKPGSFSQTNSPMTNAGTREIRPSLRSIQKADEEDRSTWIYYFGQLYDNQICFTIHARSNKEANQVATWFQNLLSVHKKFFALKGIIRYYFIERESDSVVKEGDSVIHVRPLMYYLTTEEVSITTEQVLQKIKLNLKTT